ncbi:MAG: osmotically inducible protein OsmC [Gammaproteobacteria bacterium]|nr:MAG: osmotically inducible protein OsmC [Gammaproteobacteria bacterium]
MQSLPHLYSVTANANPESYVTLSTEGIAPIESAPPVQFGGPGDHWSPEDLLVAALADCFILTFKAVSRASKFDWQSLSCTVDGTLDRIEKATQFTAFTIKADLTVASDADQEKAQKLLEKSEHVCLITNSLKAPVHLEARIVVA